MGLSSSRGPLPGILGQGRGRRLARGSVCISLLGTPALSPFKLSDLMAKGRLPSYPRQHRTAVEMEWECSQGFFFFFNAQGTIWDFLLKTKNRKIPNLLGTCEHDHFRSNQRHLLFLFIATVLMSHDPGTARGGQRFPWTVGGLVKHNAAGSSSKDRGRDFIHSHGISLLFQSLHTQKSQPSTTSNQSHLCFRKLPFLFFKAMTN